MIPVLLTKSELRRFFPEDPRTIIARHALEADAIVIAGGHELSVYALEKIQELAAQTPSVTKNAVL